MARGRQPPDGVPGQHALAHTHTSHSTGAHHDRRAKCPQPPRSRRACTFVLANRLRLPRRVHGRVHARDRPGCRRVGREAASHACVLVLTQQACSYSLRGYDSLTRETRPLSPLDACGWLLDDRPQVIPGTIPGRSGECPGRGEGRGGTVHRPAAASRSVPALGSWPCALGCRYDRNISKLHLSPDTHLQLTY